MLHYSRVLAALALTAGATTSYAQSVPTRQLSKADAEFADPFTQIAAVRELRNGRVLVVDPRDKVVQLVDIAGGSATKVGREGQGPGEYSLPMALVALPGDSSGVFDPLNQRYLLIDPTGKPAGFLSTRAEDDPDERRDAGGGANRGGPMFRMGGVAMTPPRGTDRSGNIYVAGSPFRMGPDGPTPSDSAPLQRFDRVKKSYETIGYIQLPKNNSQVSGGAGRMEVRIGGANPFAPRDEWAVAPDGRIAIVHAADYRVEWIAPNGQRTGGTATPYAKTKVTDKHKKWWQDTQRRRGTGMMITNNNGRMSATSAPVGALPPEERNDWPEYLPPFMANAAQVAPNGELWVLRAAASEDVAPTYDVFDGSGKLSARVQLAKRSRVVGFGNGTVYVARFDEDDLQYLQRYRLQ
jgi:hypothetical protein